MKRLLGVLSLATALSTQALTAESPRTTWSGVYTTEQAKRGKELYLLNCAAACHVENLMGNGPAPSLAGNDFLLRWEDFTLGELLDQINTTMPKATPGLLSSDEYVAVIAFMLLANGFPAGKTPLPTGATDLGRIVIAGAK